MTFASATALFTISPAYATMYFEVGDAGTSDATAEYIPWQTTTIAGALHDYDGADVYGFEWGGGFFFADTIGSGFDTMLSLFDQSGSLLTFNDDFGSSFSQVSLTLGNGNYFLGITYYPNNYQGDMRYYLETGIEASYQINKSISHPMSKQLPESAASVNDIPEPASIALIVIGLAGIMLNRRFKKYVTTSL
jgi:hypothetical protein